MWMFMIIMPIIVLFFEDKGLSLTEIFWLQTVFAVTMIIFELPSGYICDLLGRKGTLIVASVFHGVGYSIFPLADDFIVLAVAEIFLGLGVSLFSGTDTSMMYDTMSVIAPKKPTIKFIGHMLFYRQMGEFVGAVVGGWIVFYGLHANAVANAIVSWLPLVVAYTLKEPPRELMSKTNHRENFKYIFSSLFRHSTLLNLLLLNTVLYAVSTLTAVWSYQGRWQEIGIDAKYFGYLWGGCNLFIAILGRYAYKVEKGIGSTVTLLLFGVTPALCFCSRQYCEYCSRRCSLLPYTVYPCC
ncbi:MAG: MFS transporter [Bdellovibrionales bacterium]